MEAEFLSNACCEASKTPAAPHLRSSCGFHLTGDSNYRQHYVRMTTQTEKTNTSSIDLSIILEWENVLLAESERCFRMLRQLRNQLEETPHTVEVLVLFNPEQVDRPMIQQALDDYLRLAEAAVSRHQLRIEEARGSHYYELKNEGAAKARGDVIIFIDSDVIPEDDWLKEISQPFFECPEITVVAGNTYLAYDSILEKAFALAWFFPLREPANSIHSDSTHFFANSVAFRRDVFLKYRFPIMQSGVTRGACADLAHLLASSGIPIWTNTGARASHPPPSDLHHYVTRGLSQGRDKVLPRIAAGQSRLRALVGSLRWSKTQIQNAAPRIIKDRKRVNLALWQAPGALGIIVCYYSLSVGGSCITALSPGYAAKHWQI